MFPTIKAVKSSGGSSSRIELLHFEIGDGRPPIRRIEYSNNMLNTVANNTILNLLIMILVGH